MEADHAGFLKTAGLLKRPKLPKSKRMSAHLLFCLVGTEARKECFTSHSNTRVPLKNARADLRASLGIPCVKGCIVDDVVGDGHKACWRVLGLAEQH